MEISGVNDFLGQVAMVDAPMKNPVIEELKKREHLVSELRKQLESVTRLLAEQKPFDAIRKGNIPQAQEMQITHRSLKKEFNDLSKKLEEAEKSVHMAKERVSLYEEEDEESS